MAGKKFIVTNTIRFNHCDPANIVFFPRYFEMSNRALEKFFVEVLETSFLKEMKKNIITPSRHLETDFIKPCFLEEVITITITILKLGRSSIQFKYDFTGQDTDDLRLTIKQTILFASHKPMKAIAIPADLKEKMVEYLV